MGRAELVCWDLRDGATERDRVRAHAALTRLARERAAADAEEGRWLLVAWRSGAHVHMGHSSFAEYVERLAAWLHAARGKTTRQIEAMVAGNRPGDATPDPSRDGDWPAPRQHVLRFEVSPETFATFRDAMQNLRRSAGGALDDDAVLIAMARQALGAPIDDGRSSCRVSYQVCPGCGQGAQVACGELVAVSSEVVAMTACDAECIRLPPTLTADEKRPPVANDTVAAAPATAAHVGRARQAVPPALRRAVLARDRRRCRVPGCKNTHFVDVHHLRPRSEGGENKLENLITLCTAHHRATHRGELIIETAADGLGFQHADGTHYGTAVAASSIDTHARVFGALRNLGFREREARAVLVELRNDASMREASTEHLLREALQRVRRAR
jgi:5-methylcytosine-specific restriction endonuclease McrA